LAWIPFGPQKGAKVGWLVGQIYPHARALISRGPQKRSNARLEVHCELDRAEIEDLEGRLVEEVMMGFGASADGDIEVQGGKRRLKSVHIIFGELPSRTASDGKCSHARLGLTFS